MTKSRQSDDICIPPIQRCKNLQDIRNHIDALDEQIIPLLCERIQYITQAAQFKDSVADTRRFGRIEAIVTRAKAYAAVLGADEDYIEAVYRALIDESIRQEKAKWLELNQR
ncbi:MAG: chorismate mutase [Gammaproteobacteria bacterium]|nr:MAG: chorismate mutase [Gammaproteobacteria bacterium]